MPRKFLRYNPHLKQLAHNLRNRSTTAEVLLWQQLKGKQMLEYDFHRQKPIDEYIVDFYCCPKPMLAIELDGSSHSDQIEADKLRQRKLESLGIRFLRFQENDVRQNLEGVVHAIHDRTLEHREP